MAILAGLLGVLFFVCVALAVISLFKPGTAFFLKQKSKGKALLSWLGLALVCAIGGGMLTPTQPEAPQEAPAVEAFTWSEEQEKERQASIANMVTKSAPAQAEVQTLYKELLAMRGTTEFVELGFSSKNRIATNWKQRVEALRGRIEKDGSIAPQVRAAPAYLLSLGLHKEWRKGGTSDMAKWDEEMVLEGINWKPEK